MWGELLMWESSKLAQFSGSLFVKVQQLIESYIEQGLLIAGERLPSERDLAQKLALNRSTIIHALDLLTERGVLIRRRGSGTFVNDQKWGLQTHPTINWRLPATFHSQKSNLYQQKVMQIRSQQLTKNSSEGEVNNIIQDLGNGDLPTELFPKLTLSNISISELVGHEKNSDNLQLGLPSLKQQIANYMQQLFGMTVDLNQILITSGTQQSLFLITQGLLKPGDAIGIESPSYFYSLPLFQAAGLRLYGITVDDEGITIESLKQAVNQYHIKWLLLNPIFQNPTGYVMSKRRKEAILAFCRTNCIGIIEDDAYSGLAFNPILDISPIKKLDSGNQVIYLGSLSKYIGRTIRIGWMIAPREIISKLAEIRQQIDSGLSILPQLLAEDYLKNHYQDHQKFLRVTLQKRLAKMRQWLDLHFADQLSYKEPHGGYHLYAHFIDSKQKSNLLNRLLAEGIIVSQGEDFGDKSGAIRFSYAHYRKSESAGE
ncbi:PLP-dependent aminotransferase family protein [Orbaceae bacterium ESL0721]|nr:PLP-dependent aminotransferase family protein [Orbaceae bacterium ESL0721]